MKAKKLGRSRKAGRRKKEEEQIFHFPFDIYHFPFALHGECSK
jgi:hypothetical protein